MPELEVLELAKEYILKLESEKCSFDFIKSAFKHINHYSINYVSDISQRFVDFLGKLLKMLLMISILKLNIIILKQLMFLLIMIYQLILKKFQIFNLLKLNFMIIIFILTMGK